MVADKGGGSAPGLGLRLALLQERMKALYGKQCALANDLGVSNGEVSKWLKGQHVPKNDRTFFRLCERLLLDPLWLLDISEDNLRDLIMLLKCQMRLPGRSLAMLEALRPLLLPQGSWPPDRLGDWSPEWCIWCHEHEGGTHGTYLRVRIRPAQSPIALHWAWQDPPREEAPNPPWWVYGVLLVDERVVLLNYNGLSQECAWNAQDGFVARTWLGPGAATFRICSIGRFTAMNDGCDARGHDPECVTFGFVTVHR